MEQNQLVEVCFIIIFIFSTMIDTITAVDCGPLTNLTNGLVHTSNGTTFGSTATYTCDTGYMLSGSQSRTCGADGSWTSLEPFCEGSLN